MGKQTADARSGACEIRRTVFAQTRCSYCSDLICDQVHSPYCMLLVMIVYTVNYVKHCNAKLPLRPRYTCFVDA